MKGKKTFKVMLLKDKVCSYVAHRNGEESRPRRYHGRHISRVERLYVTQNDFETTVDIGTMYVGGKSALAL